MWLFITWCYSGLSGCHHVCRGGSTSRLLFSKKKPLNISLIQKHNQNPAGVTCVGHWLLVGKSIKFSTHYTLTLHALVWRCRHIFSPPAEPKKRAPPVSVKGHCRAYRTELQPHWWLTEEEKATNEGWMETMKMAQTRDYLTCTVY